MAALAKINAMRKKMGNTPVAGAKRKAPDAAGAAKKKVKAAAKKGGAAAKPARPLEGLDWMLGYEKETFVKEHWEKQGLHVKRGDKGYYGKLLPGLGSVEALWERMEKGEVAPSRINMFRCRDGSTKETPEPAPQTWQEIKALFEQGWSMQWLQPQHEDDHLAKLVAVLESHFGSLVGVNAYLTPPNAQGLAPHYDDVEVFVMQLSGEKKWSLHKSTAQTPLPAEQQTLPRFTSCDLQLDLLEKAYMTPTLHSGDLLYFPRGTIHWAPSVGTVPSIHLTVSTYQRNCMYEVVQKVFEETMAMLWNEELYLRKGIPMGMTALGGDAAPAQKAVAKCLRSVHEVVTQQPPLVKLGVDQIAGDFVACRHPPLFHAPPGGAEVPEMIKPEDKVVLPDPSVLALAELPPEAEDEGPMFSLLHCVNNARATHMMGKAPDAAPKDGAEEGEEEDEEEEEEEEEGEENANNVILDEAAAGVVTALCKASPKLPLGCHPAAPAGFDWASVGKLASHLHGVPSQAREGVLEALQELEFLRLVWVQRA